MSTAQDKVNQIASLIDAWRRQSPSKELANALHRLTQTLVTEEQNQAFRGVESVLYGDSPEGELSPLSVLGQVREVLGLGELEARLAETIAEATEATNMISDLKHQIYQAREILSSVDCEGEDLIAQAQAAAGDVRRGEWRRVRIQELEDSILYNISEAQRVGEDMRERAALEIEKEYITCDTSDASPRQHLKWAAKHVRALPISAVVEAQRPAPLTEEEALAWYCKEYEQWLAQEDGGSLRKFCAGLIARASRGKIPSEVRPVLTYDEEAEIIASAPGTIAPDKNWLSKQADQAEEEMRSWPEWKRQLSRRAIGMSAEEVEAERVKPHHPDPEIDAEVRADMALGRAIAKAGIQDGWHRGQPISAPIDPDSGTRETWTPQVGKRVRTAEKLTSQIGGTWAAHRQTNVPGVITYAFQAHNKRYMVSHDDGTEAPYDRGELRPEYHSDTRKTWIPQIGGWVRTAEKLLEIPDDWPVWPRSANTIGKVLFKTDGFDDMWWVQYENGVRAPHQSMELRPEPSPLPEMAVTTGTDDDESA